MTATRFSGAEQEESYRFWRGEHPTVFVLNTYLQRKACYLVVRCASSSCAAMKNLTRVYAKVCGTLAEIEAYIIKEFGVGTSSQPLLRCLW